MSILLLFTISCVNIRNKYLLRINILRKKTTDQATDTETDTVGLAKHVMFELNKFEYALGGTPLYRGEGVAG